MTPFSFLSSQSVVEKKKLLEYIETWVTKERNYCCTNTKTHKENTVNTVMAQNHTSSSLTSVVGQPPMVHVKQEPSFLPRLDSTPSLGQEAGTASGRQSQVGAGGHAVTK